MSYQVTCACGKSHAVTLADAGTSLPCGCGRTVEVPPLHKLREHAGETALADDGAARNEASERSPAGSSSLEPPRTRKWAACRERSATKPPGQVPPRQRPMRESASGLPALQRSVLPPTLRRRALRQPLQLPGAATQRIAVRQLCATRKARKPSGSTRIVVRELTAAQRVAVRTRKLRAGQLAPAALERIGALELADAAVRGSAKGFAPLLGSDHTRARVRAE